MINKRIFTLILFCSLCVACVGLLHTEVNAAELASGTCGDNLTWVLTDDGVLTINGTGSMFDYSESNPAPWNEFQEEITSAVVESGVTTIGSNAFWCCYKLEDVKLPNTLTSIGQKAFQECYKLANITIPEGVTSLGYHMFNNCFALKYVTIPSTVKTIPAWMFYNCMNLAVVVIPDSVRTIEREAFGWCTNLWHVLFTGSQSRWSSINCQSGTSNSLACLGNAKVHYNCYGGEVKDVANKVCTLCCQHSWGSSKTTKEPTCTEEGKKSYTCTKCAGTKTETIAAIGHDYSVEVAAPTCTEQGFTTYTCSRCNEIKVDDYTEVVDHGWDEGVVAKPSTETAVGEMLYTCEGCGLTKTEEIPMLDPAPTVPTEPAPSNPEEPSSTKPAPTIPTSQPVTEPSAPPVGDTPADNSNSTLIIVIVVAVIAVGGVAVLILVKKKK